MAIVIVLLGLFIALAILGTVAQPQYRNLRAPAALLAMIILVGAVVGASVRHISADEVGIVTKNVGTKRLQSGAYIAVNGEQGIQADVLAPGWHFGYWPFIFDVKEVALTEVPSGSVGIVEARDGQALPSGQVIAPDWKEGQLQQMLDARHFLTPVANGGGGGFRGIQATVLSPGKYRLNTALFRVREAPMTEVLAGEVAVLKANYGTPASITINPQVVPAVIPATADGKSVISNEPTEPVTLAKPGEIGIRADVLGPGRYAINTEAFNITEIWTTEMTAQFTKAAAGNPVSPGDSTLQEQLRRRQQQREQKGRELTPIESTSARAAASAVAQPVMHDASLEEREITVRTSDGFSFPVDVRVAYRIRPEQAPIVVAKLGDDEGERFRNVFNSAVRAIFRNNAESVRALDYVQQRSHQESQSLKMLSEELARFGVTVTAVRIGNVGDEQTLGTLLKTQTDREIAKQEQVTTVEQQKAAEQQKSLLRIRQEAEEEKRLATAAYGVKIATEEQKRKITEAQAEAESTTIKAKAQADAYRLIATQIGKSNAALLEILKVVGEKNINIAPRVMVTGGGGKGLNGAEGTALIGTMLDTMISRDPEPAASPAKP